MGRILFTFPPQHRLHPCGSLSLAASSYGTVMLPLLYVILPHFLLIPSFFNFGFSFWPSCKMVKTLSHSSRMVCLKRRWFSGCIYAASKCSHTFFMLCEWHPLVTRSYTIFLVLPFCMCFIRLLNMFAFFLSSPCSTMDRYSCVVSTLTSKFYHVVSFLVLEMTLPLCLFNAVLIWSNFQAHVCLTTASKSFFGGLIYCALMVYCMWHL